MPNSKDVNVGIIPFCEGHHAEAADMQWAVANCRTMYEVWQKAGWKFLLWIASRPGVLSQFDRTKVSAALVIRTYEHLDVESKFKHKRQLWAAQLVRDAKSVVDTVCKTNALHDDRTAERARGLACSRGATWPLPCHRLLFTGLHQALVDGIMTGLAFWLRDSFVPDFSSDVHAFGEFEAPDFSAMELAVVAQNMAGVAWAVEPFISAAELYTSPTGRTRRFPGLDVIGIDYGTVGSSYTGIAMMAQTLAKGGFKCE